MESSRVSNALSLIGYTILGSGMGIATYYAMSKGEAYHTQYLYAGTTGGALGIGLGLILENSRPLKVIDEENNKKTTQLSIGGSLVELTKETLLPASVITSAYILSSAIGYYRTPGA